MLNNRVAHRLVMLLLMASLIPVVFLAIPSLNFVTQKLYRQLQAELAESSRHWGLALEERLDFMGSELRILALDHDPTAPQWLDDQTLLGRLKHWFEGIALVDSQGHSQILMGQLQIPSIYAHEMEQIKQGRPQLVHRQTDRWHFYLIQSTGSQVPHILIAELKPDVLWQIKEAIPSHRNGCVLYHDMRPLVCSHQHDGTHLKAYQDKLYAYRIGYVETQHQDQSWFESFWSDFNADALIQPPWTVVVSTPTRQAFVHISEFLWLFPLLLVMATVLVFLMSFSQIKRVVVPLEKLREGTKNIANQAFHTEVDIDSGDEFEELARSFNSMSTRLGKQFSTLETMARIDRMILSTLDMNSIVETILTRMVHAIPCDGVSMIIIHEKKKNLGRIYFKNSHVSSEISERDVELTPDELLLLHDSPKQLFVEPPQLIPAYLRAIHHLGHYFLLLPIFLEQNLASIIILSYKKYPKYQSDDLKQARDLADRIAVALSNAAWENKLYQQAHYDTLTQLPNRLLFQDRMHHALKRANRHGNHVVLMFLDLDHFKTLNDSLGHAAGDDFLKETANRIKNCVRNIDTVARLGGDEFTIIIPDLESNHDLIANISSIASKILQSTCVPLRIEDQNIVLTVSIGIAIYPTDANNFSDLLKTADSALYYAKGKGKSNYQFYSEDIDAEARALLKIEHDLKQALSKNEFKLFFQPRVSLEQKKIVGAEALIRWQNQEHELSSPADFIPIAEDNGLILTLGEWILRQACQACKSWHQAGFSDMKISVNLSALQFKDKHLIHRIQKALHDVHLEPEYLELEITEGTLIKDIDHAIKITRAFKNLGISIAIDDFGTGYSSLSYLKKFPVQALKIDQSFVRHIDQDKDNVAIVAAIITLAKHLDLHVVAEGVESRDELAVLQQTHCQEIQGYFFSKPLNEDDFIEFLNNHPSFNL